MADPQEAISLAIQKVSEADAVVKKFIGERLASKAETPERAALNATIEEARKALAAAELNLRKCYELKGDG